MVATTEEFITHFHTLDGTTIGEKRKSLSFLLNNIQDPRNINVNSIQPRNPLEENFKIEILIRYKKVPELIEVLKHGNPILIEKILKVSSWILEEILEHVGNEDALVELIFPCLSFNVKLKIINKLAVYLKNPERADRIFNAINKKYGSYLASKLLPSCSKDVIVKCLRTSKIEVTSRQLLIIIKKNLVETEDILNALLEYHSKEIIQEKYDMIFKYIARNNLLLFLRLYKTFKPNIQLGWRSTAKVIFQDKELFIKNSKKLYEIFHKKQVAKSLSDKFSEFYFYLLPSLKEFKSNSNFYLELIPTNFSRFNLFVTVFKKKYNIHLLEQPELITPGLLELMLIDEREVWMNSNTKPKYFDEDSWICLMKIEKALPALKRKISMTSDIKERAELVGCLVETCRINNDISALSSVLKHVVAQHKNDTSSVLFCAINTMKKYFTIDDLEEEHWKYINEIVQIFMTRRELPFYYFEWLYNYINFRLSKGLPIKLELIDIAGKTQLDLIQCSTYMKQRNFKKQFLIEYGKLFDEIHKGDTTETKYIEYLQSIKQWNKKYPKDKINICINQKVYDILIKFLKEKEYQFTASYIAELFFELHVFAELNEEDKNVFFDILFKAQYFCNDMNFFEWLIRHNPLLVKKYIDQILNYILDLWKTALTPLFWIYCKNYQHLEIPQKIIANCQLILKDDEESDTKKKNSIMALSYLMNSEDFLDLIKSYYPSDIIINVNDEENQEIYKIQQAITANLKNVIPPLKMVESVLQFAKGDYLKYVQRSLYSISHSAPEMYLINFFTLLSDRPVSVRKHAIYLGFKVLNKSEICKILKLMEHEKNSSICKFLLKASFSYFCKNPLEEFSWQVAKKYMKLVDINDKEVLDVLMDIKKVPKIRLVDYFMLTWEFLEEHTSNQEAAFVTAKISLLNSLDLKVFPDVPSEFCLNIIEKYFLKSDQLSDFHKAIICFSVKCLIYSTCETDQEEYLKSISERLKKCIDLFDWKKSKMKTVISFFVKEFCDPFRNRLSLNNHLVKRLLDCWNALLKPYEAFDEYLCFNFTFIFLNVTIVEVSVKLAEFCNDLLGVYGVVVADLFYTCLKPHISNFLCKIADDDNDLENETLLILLENIIRFSNSINCLSMAIALLPKDIPEAPILQKKYREIVKELENNDDLRVHLCMSVYLERFEIAKVGAPLYEGLGKTRESKRDGGCFTSIVEYNSKYKK